MEAFQDSVTLIKKGAEAELHLEEWMGRKVIIKKRIRKKYRSPELDDMLRSTRIKIEVRLMSEARAIGISVPIIYDIDTFKNEIVMEYIEGPQVKQLLSEMDEKRREEICTKIGTLVGKLHKNDIVHGDLTTSNILFCNDKLYFIDFSLGEKSGEIEKKGVDLHLLKEAFKSAHSEIMDSFNCVIEGYIREYDNAKKVISKMKEIEKRGRYT